MNIHTTQDLSVLAKQQLSSTNSVSLSNIRFAQGNNNIEDDQGGIVVKNTPNKSVNYKVINTAVLLSGLLVIASLAGALSRKTKAQNKIIPEELKKTIREVKGVKVGDIKPVASIDQTPYDPFLNSKFFDWALNRAENEPVMQAGMAALICIILRPATIMALPSKKDKENNMYASAHSISSGLVGLLATLLIAQPFKESASYTMKNLFKDFKEDALKRLYPNLDIKSIYKNTLTKERKPVEEWLFKDGNKFVMTFKDVEKIPKLKPFNEISAESFKEFNADVDWASQKGKSFNDVITRDGKKLYDVIDWNRIGIVITQEYTGGAQLSSKMLKESTGEARILLRDLDRNFLETVIKDADKSSYWKKLDINSVYKDNKVVDFRQWKDIEGKQWKLDLDNAYISSPYDTATYLPRISGKYRIEPTGEIKYAAYLKNGKNGELGTVVDEERSKIQKRREVFEKLLTWTPDIVTRPLVATATIALIPVALKRIFHLEKPKKQETTPVIEEQVKQDEIKVEELKPIEQANVSFKGNLQDDDENNSNNLTFKGKKPGKDDIKGIKKLFQEWIVKPLAKIYGKPMYESKAVFNVADRLSKAPGEMTNHMASLGSLLTSSVYMYQTLNKKDLDDDRRKTLAINQGLCFIVPTVCAYTVDKALKDWTKNKIEYRYAGLRERDIAMAKFNKKSAEELMAMQEGLGKKLAGVRTLISLAVFALIYRYVAPVLITPIANKIGDNIIERKHAKAEAEAKTVTMEPSNKVKMETEKAHSAA